jgi:hypothetical protein
MISKRGSYTFTTHTGKDRFHLSLHLSKQTEQKPSKAHDQHSIFLRFSQIRHNIKSNQLRCQPLQMTSIKDFLPPSQQTPIQRLNGNLPKIVGRKISYLHLTSAPRKIFLMVQLAQVLVLLLNNHGIQRVHRRRSILAVKVFPINFQSNPGTLNLLRLNN